MPWASITANDASNQTHGNRARNTVQARPNSQRHQDQPSDPRAPATTDLVRLLAPPTTHTQAAIVHETPTFLSLHRQHHRVASAVPRDRHDSPRNHAVETTAPAETVGAASAVIGRGRGVDALDAAGTGALCAGDPEGGHVGGGAAGGDPRRDARPHLGVDADGGEAGAVFRAGGPRRRQRDGQAPEG